MKYILKFEDNEDTYNDKTFYIDVTQEELNGIQWVIDNLLGNYGTFELIPFESFHFEKI